MSHILIGHLTQAASFYRGQLHAVHRAVAYLRACGLHGDIAVRYGLGCVPAGFQTLCKVLPSYNDRVLKKAGLVAVNNDGRRYDCFCDRIVPPILDDAGSVTGFSGRVLEGNGPKYPSSPETEVFQKGYMLFGLTRAAKVIVATNTAYVVRGYLDVVSLAQHGMQNAVAMSGTATTGQHMERLLGLAKRVIFCFGGDDAGRRAAVCTLDMCPPHVTNVAGVSFLFLPRDYDLDNYVRAKGRDTSNDLVLEASSLEGFSLANIMQSCQLEYAEDRTWLVITATLRLQQVNTPAMLCRILTTITGPSKFSVGGLVDLCGLEKNILSTIGRQ